MTLFNTSFEYLECTDRDARATRRNGQPVTLLYSLLAGTYGGAAAAAGANDHHSLRRCYVVSAALHGLIGVCHHMGI